MGGYDDLIGTIPEIVNEAIMAEMRFYGYYPDGHGGYQGMGGLGGAPPPIAGPNMPDDGMVIPDMLNGGSISVRGIYHKWAERIPTLFNVYLGLPDPDDFQAEADQLRKALEQLASQGKTSDGNHDNIDYEGNSTLALADTVAQRLATWQGVAALSFQNYLNLFGQVVANQALATEATRACIYMERELWARTRNDVYQLAANARAAFSHCGEISVDDVKAVISAVSTVNTVLGWFPAFKAVTAPTGKALSIANVFVNTFGGQSPPENPLSARGVEDCWNKIVKASDDLKSKVKTVEGDIDKSLSNIYDRISASHTRPDGSADQEPYVLPRPTGVLNADEKSDFIKVAVDPPAVREAGDMLRKDLAPEMRTAAKSLDASDNSSIWNRRAEIGIGATGAYLSYLNTTDFLHDEIKQTADELDWAGDVLDAIADNYEKGDAAIATALAEVHQRIVEESAPPPGTGGHPTGGGHMVPI